ncbi:MAG TPA: FtsQ-type POTRA domain-containing protein [Gaiellales bacterium]|nr:FtsQ-type POTRA domain-containing protein [Gaiellales bacterium]
MQIVSGIDDALLVRRRELMRAQGRRRLMILLAVVGTLGVLGGYKLLEMSSAFAVDNVAVNGAPPGLRAEIAAAVSSTAAGHSLLTVDRGAIERRLEQMPYVRSVSIDRAFPHTLAVTVQVERPAVAVEIAKTAYLVSADGRVLESRSTPPAHLPIVQLPAGTTLLVGRASGDANVDAALSVLRQATPDFVHHVGRITELQPHGGLITAVVGTRLKLRLGTPDQLPLKLAVVERVMKRITRAQRAEVAYIDVSAPGRPAYGLRSTLPSG